MNGFLDPKLLKTFFSIAGFILVSQSLSSADSCVLDSMKNCKWWQGECRTEKEICSTDEDGNCWKPPRIIDSNWNNCFERNSKVGLNCPKYDELNQNHTLYLIDTTNGTSEDFKSRLDVIIDVDTELVANTAPYSRVTFIELTDTENVVGLESELTMCRPRTGKEGSPYLADMYHEEEGSQFVQKNFMSYFIDQIGPVIEKIKKAPASDKSLIFEHLKQINLPKYKFSSYVKERAYLEELINNPNTPDEERAKMQIELKKLPGNDYKNRRIVMLSDFLQNSKRFDMWTICKESKKRQSKWKGACDSFDSFYERQKEKDRFYLDQMKPSFDESTVVEMHHLQTCYVQSAQIEMELMKLWTSYFEWAGVPKENISYQLVQDSGLKDSSCK